MIARYTRPEMGRIWSDQNKFRSGWRWSWPPPKRWPKWARFPRKPRGRCARTPASIPTASARSKREVKHDVIAFTTAVAETMAAAGHAEASRWFHYGLTSNDVVDTAQALQLKQASVILLSGLVRLRDVLKRRALEFQHTVQIGRTHGVHAEPITFGLKLAIWYEEAGPQSGTAAGGGRRIARGKDFRRGGHLRAHRAGG